MIPERNLSNIAVFKGDVKSYHQKIGIIFGEKTMKFTEILLFQGWAIYTPYDKLPSS